MTERLYILMSAFVGILTGIFTIYSIFHYSSWSMLLWVVLGIAVLFFSPSRRAALYAGSSFGFLTICSWLASGYGGSSDSIPGFLVMLLIFSILGGICGGVGALMYNQKFK